MTSNGQNSSPFKQAATQKSKERIKILGIWWFEVLYGGGIAVHEHSGWRIHSECSAQPKYSHPQCRGRTGEAGRHVAVGRAARVTCWHVHGTYRWKDVWHSHPQKPKEPQQSLEEGERLPLPWEVWPTHFLHPVTLLWIGVGAEFCPSPAAPMCKLFKHLWGDAVFVSSPGNISQSLEGFEFYISDLSVYGKTDQIIAHNSNTFQDNCDCWTESTQKESINYDSEIVIKEDRMRLLAGGTVVALPPNNTRA